jgi:hypothetical protein
MSKQFPDISSELADWISRQRVFFVATAPLSAEGHVNASPKGGEAFRVLGPLEVRTIRGVVRRRLLICGRMAGS